MTDVAHRTTVVAGSTTLVNFTGSAPHGGGSCQFGLNYHGLPTYSTDNPADWKTIYTIIGGCPAEIVSTAGNLEEPPYFRGVGEREIPDAVHCGDDKGVDCIRQFEIPFPKGLPNGDATFAWMWYNRITRDEVYMMCAPVTITGGVEAGSPEGTRFVEELPVMFLANIKGFANCTTSTTGDHGVFNIPNPGRYGVQLIEPDPRAAGDCPVAPPPKFEGDASVPAPSPAPGPAPGPDAASSSTFLTSTRSSSPLDSATRSTVEGRRTSTQFVTLTQGILTVTTTVTAPSTTTAEREVPALTRPYFCATEGSLVCIEDYWFGVCSAGVVYPTPLANMLICENGQIGMRPGM